MLCHRIMIHSDYKEASNTVVYQHSRNESCSQSFPSSGFSSLNCSTLFLPVFQWQLEREEI